VVLLSGLRWLLPLAALLGAMVAGPARAALQRGQASWYGQFHEGRLMANQRPFRMTQATVAHRTLPLGTMVELRNLENGRMAKAEVTDRGPYVRGRVLDVSRAIAERLHMVHPGTAPVEIRVLAQGD
jgi:rare lipoprotein A